MILIKSAMKTSMRKQVLHLVCHEALVKEDKLNCRNLNVGHVLDRSSILLASTRNKQLS